MGTRTLKLVVCRALRGGKRSAATMSLIQSARMNRHDPYAYPQDVLTRPPAPRASEIGQLLPHQWMPTGLNRAEPGGLLLLVSVRIEVNRIAARNQSCYPVPRGRFAVSILCGM